MQRDNAGIAHQHSSGESNQAQDGNGQPNVGIATELARLKDSIARLADLHQDLVQQFQHLAEHSCFRDAAPADIPDATPRTTSTIRVTIAHFPKVLQSLKRSRNKMKFLTEEYTFGNDAAPNHRYTFVVRMAFYQGEFGVFLGRRKASGAIPNSEELSWPIDGTLRLVIENQRDPSKHRSYIFDPVTEDQPFFSAQPPKTTKEWKKTKVKTELDVEYGGKILSESDILSGEYLDADGSLTVLIKFTPS